MERQPRRSGGSRFLCALARDESVKTSGLVYLARACAIFRTNAGLQQSLPMGLHPSCELWKAARRYVRPRAPAHREHSR